MQSFLTVQPEALGEQNLYQDLISGYASGSQFRSPPKSNQLSILWPQPTNPKNPLEID